MVEKEKMGKINDEMENIASTWFFLSWFQHDISKVLRNKEISCFTHKPVRVWLSLDKSTILSGCFHQNLKKNKMSGGFYTFDQQTSIAGRCFKHWDLQAPCSTFKHILFVPNAEVSLDKILHRNKYNTKVVIYMHK